jgi:hypothetical protein
MKSIITLGIILLCTLNLTLAQDTPASPDPLRYGLNGEGSIYADTLLIQRGSGGVGVKIYQPDPGVPAIQFKSISNFDSAGVNLVVDHTTIGDGQIIIGDVGRSVMLNTPTSGTFYITFPDSNNPIVDNSTSLNVLTMGGGGNQTAFVHTIHVPIIATATLNFGDIAPNSSADLTMTATGAVDGDVVSVGRANVVYASGTNMDNITFDAWVSASNVVTVRCTNHSATNTANPASGTFKVSVVH